MVKQIQDLVDDIAANCLAYRVRVASRDITRLYDDRLRPLGLRVTQLSVLVAVEKMKEALPSQIGDALHLDRSTLSRTLERLKLRGWLEELDTDDGRSRPVRLSASGRQIIRKAHPVWKSAQQEASRSWAGTQIENLLPP